jgi:pyruvate formate lyase activating enzyme
MLEVLIVAKCGLCGRESVTISRVLGYCADCIKGHWAALAQHFRQLHTQTRAHFGLAGEPPRNPSGKRCHICSNACEITENCEGFCGAWKNVGGRLKSATGSPNKASVQWYYDALPTNCVADWVCPESSHYGYKNLSVFYESCNFDCLYCQNWQFRERQYHTAHTAEELAQSVDGKTACICYFGGDPTPQIIHALKSSSIARHRKKKLRICWETNGGVNPRILKKIVELSLKSGGIIKFDVKTFSEELSLALCGVSNRRTLENFCWSAQEATERAEQALVVASTLLVPGYIDEFEVSRIAKMIASIDRRIPYALLGFHPHYVVDDLPRTSHSHAARCENAARAAGLENVRIGNAHLLSKDYN